MLRSVLLLASGIIVASQLAYGDVSETQRAMYEIMLSFPDRVKGGTIDPLWIGAGNRFIYRSGTGEARRWVQVDAASGKQEPLFDDGRELTLVGADQVRFQRGDRWYEQSLQDGAVRELSPERVTLIQRRTPRKIRSNHPVTLPDTYEIPTPDGERLLAARDGNLWIRNVVDDKHWPLTHDGVDRDEWVDGVWSPDGQTVAAFRVDSRNADYVPVVHWLQRKEEVEYRLFPKAGGILPQCRLYFIDATNGRRIHSEIGDDAAYVRPLGWHPNQREFLYFLLSWDGKRIELRAADTSTGTPRLLWTESASTFAVATMQFLEGRPTFAPLADGRFIVASERSGWNHLYLYAPGATQPIRQLSQGNFPIKEIVSVDERKGFVYFTANADAKRVYDTHLMRVRLDGKELKQLTTATGEHRIRMSPSSEYFLDTHSTVSRPPVTELRRADGALVKSLESADISELTRLGWQAPEEFVVKAADGKTDLHGILRKPWNFDPGRKYPVVEHIYGGPQRSNVPHAFGDPHSHMIFANALAQLGFIVINVDARGTPDRSKAFQDVVYGNMGRYEIADHAAAIREAAATRPFMDLERVGIFGSSYGGYYAVRALLQAPQLYKVGVASAPVVELESLAAGSVENYMGGRPQDVPEAYAYGSNLRLADKLEGKLLILHPTSDVNVPFANAIKLVDALVRADKRYDLNLLPEANHYYQYADSERRHVFWWNTTRDYLVEHLRP